MGQDRHPIPERREKQPQHGRIDRAVAEAHLALHQVGELSGRVAGGTLSLIDRRCLAAESKVGSHHPPPLIFTPRGVACATGGGVIIVVPRAASSDDRGIASRGRHVRIGTFFALRTPASASLPSPMRSRSPTFVLSAFDAGCPRNLPAQCSSDSPSPARSPAGEPMDPGFGEFQSEKAGRPSDPTHFIIALEPGDRRQVFGSTSLTTHHSMLEKFQPGPL